MILLAERYWPKVFGLRRFGATVAPSSEVGDARKGLGVTLPFTRVEDGR